MNRVPLILAFAVLLIGCASTYKPSTEMAHLKSTLDTGRAREIFYKNILPSDIAAGLCANTGGFYRVEGKAPKMTNNGYALEVYRRGELLKSEYQAASRTTTNYYKKVFFVQEQKFENISKVRVTKNENRVCGKGDYVIALHEGTFGTIVDVAVAKENLEAFLAAMSALAPQAKLIEGVGF